MSLEAVVPPNVLDVQAIQQRCLGQLDIVCNVMDAYFRVTERDLPELEKALARGDVAKLASMAHRLKTSSAKVGATGPSQIATRIEKFCRTGRLEPLPYEVDAFCRAQAMADSAWRSLRDQLAPQL